MKKCTFLLFLFLPFTLLGQTRINADVRAEMKKVGCDKVLPTLQQKIKSGKAQPLDYYKKAWCETEKGMFKQALQSLNSCMALIPKTDPLYESSLFARSDAYMKTGELDSAIMDIQQLAKLKPKNTNYLLNLSYLYGETERFSDAIAVLHKARVLEPENYIFYVNLSYYYGEAEDYKNAIKYAEQGLTLTKNADWKGSLMNNLGYAQSKVISPEKGLQTIQSSLELKPRNAYAHFNIGRIYLALNKKDKACASFLKAKEFGGINLTMNYIKTYCK